MVLNMQTSDDDEAAVLDLDLPAFAQDALKQLLREPGILDADPSAEHLRAVITDMFQCSWMTVDGEFYGLIDAQRYQAW